ncbi:DUF4391 domain-containing protein [Lentibacillus sediminis]|uniref:DUF4391 domain-containing protein n=1 Tax=Lentibacillus sediminis TaxID=1940529 RepID=UPI000C1B9760|nr:DUF4391 domain-containing protein [Lentibacillus sediminis]
MIDEKETLQALKLPRETHVQRNFPFNRLAPQLTSENMKLFQKTVETHGVRLLATVNTKTTNIPVYEDEETIFQEIHFFQIKIKDLKWVKRVYRIIAEAMPYPLLIRFVTRSETVWIGAIHQKIAKSGLLKMQKCYTTNPKINERVYLKSWAFAQIDTYHLKAFYENLLHQMVRIELSETYGSNTGPGLEKSTTRLEAIKALDKEISSCITKAKKEVQMNKRIEWQMKVNELKVKKEKWIKGET